MKRTAANVWPPKALGPNPVPSSVPGAQVVKRSVPVASLLRPVASPSVASASPRAVLSSAILKNKRAATTIKLKRTLERLAPPSVEEAVAVASVVRASRIVVLH